MDNNKIAFISKEEARQHFTGELPPGQGRSWQPEGQPFFWLQENNKKGGAEVHEKVQDVFIVLEGNPVFIVGGELINPTKKEEGEFRAQEIGGGTRIELKPGDTFPISAGTPHQRLPNGLIFLQVFKTPVK